MQHLEILKFATFWILKSALTTQNVNFGHFFTIFGLGKM